MIVRHWRRSATSDASQISATATLISWHVGDATGARSGYVVMATVLAVLYVLLCLIMSAEEYALLAGAIVAFATLGLAMFATCGIGWPGVGETAPPDQSRA